MKDERLSVRTRENMKDVLLDPEAESPSTHYYMFRGGAEAGNITLWEMGRAGKEYIKTFGHYHTWDFKESYRLLEGEGIALLQKRRGAEDSELEDFRVVKVKAGDTLEIPLGYGHILANTGSTFLITTDDSPSDPETAKVRPHADYEPIRRMHGFAYYLIEHEGAPALLKNKNYTDIAHTDFADIPVIS